MKKSLIVLCLALIIPATVFAAGFGFKVGGAVTVDKTLGTLAAEIEGKSEEKLSIKDFAFGARVNVKLFIVDIDGTAYYKKGSNDKFGFGGLLSANLGFDIAFVRITAGLGMDYSYNGAVANKFVIGTGDGFKNAPLSWRLAADFNIKAVGIGVFAALPTEGTFANMKGLFKVTTADWKNLRVGVSVYFNIV